MSLCFFQTSQKIWESKETLHFVITYDQFHTSQKCALFEEICENMPNYDESREKFTQLTSFWN